MNWQGLSSTDIGHALIAARNKPRVERWQYYPLVPKGLIENLDFRDRINHACTKKPHLRQHFWSMCKNDLLFYCASSLYIFEPRPRPRTLPFLTYGFQDESLTTIDDRIGTRDLVLEKSRDMGVSWMVITAFQWRWQFYKNYKFLMISRVEDLVDSKDDSDTLFWKLDFLRTTQFPWLQPPADRTMLHCMNRSLGGVVDGSSTNKFAGTGGRRTAILLDEFSKMENQTAILTGTMAVSDSRFFVFTPLGTGNKAYDIAHDPKFDKVTLHWTAHPIKSRGLYFAKEKVTSGIRFEAGKPRSPWYDRQCERASHPKEIAQELDIDYLGSSFQFFDGDLLMRLRTETSRDPIVRGELPYDEVGEPMDFMEIGNGRLSLWTFLVDGKPTPDRSYAVGADISAGELLEGSAGRSRSVLSIWDLKTGEQAGEFATYSTTPIDFAMNAISVCRWFRGADGQPARLIWERNGAQGIIFTQQVLRSTEFRTFYTEKIEDRLTRKFTDKPGHHISKDSKVAMLSQMVKMWSTRRLVPRSLELLNEAAEYIYTQDGRVMHSRAAETDIPTEAGENHGDRVMAACLITKLMSDQRPLSQASVPERREATNTFAHRRKRFEESRREESVEW